MTLRTMPARQSYLQTQGMQRNERNAKKRRGVKQWGPFHHSSDCHMRPSCNCSEMDPRGCCCRTSPLALPRDSLCHCILTVAYWWQLKLLSVLTRLHRPFSWYQLAVRKQELLRCLPSPWGILWPSFLGPPTQHKGTHIKVPENQNRKVIAFNAMWNPKDETTLRRAGRLLSLTNSDERGPNGS